MTKPGGYKIAVLPGDGIGSEVTAEAEKMLQAVGRRYGHEFEMEHGLVGGAAMDATGEPLPEATQALVPRLRMLSCLAR